MNKQPFTTRKTALDTELRRHAVSSLIDNLPLDAGLEVVVRKIVKARKPDQNALMWSGPLKNIAEQAWVDGRQFHINTWHDHFKREFLPEDYIEGICKSDSYMKWDYSPSGERVLVGSTTDLTVRGFSIYLEQVLAFGANLGVMFSANPNEAYA